MARTANVCQPGVRSEYCVGDSHEVKAPPSRLQVYDAGSSAPNVNVAESRSGYSPESLVAGGSLSRGVDEGRTRRSPRSPAAGVVGAALVLVAALAVGLDGVGLAGVDVPSGVPGRAPSRDSG